MEEAEVGWMGIAPAPMAAATFVKPVCIRPVIICLSNPLTDEPFSNSAQQNPESLYVVALATTSATQNQCGFTACGKTLKLSSRRRLLPEGSAFSLAFARKADPSLHSG